MLWPLDDDHHSVKNKKIVFFKWYYINIYMCLLLNLCGFLLLFTFSFLLFSFLLLQFLVIRIVLFQVLSFIFPPV